MSVFVLYIRVIELSFVLYIIVKTYPSCYTLEL